MTPRLWKYHIDCTTSALIGFEHLVTLGEEINTVWLRKWTLPTWLFFINRYTMVYIAVISLCGGTRQVMSFGANIRVAIRFDHYHGVGLSLGVLTATS